MRSRFLLAAGAITAGFLLVWLSSAVPVLQGSVPGSALDTGPQGLSRLAMELRERGVLAATVRIDGSAGGLGLSPTPWNEWGLRPQDGVLSARSDVELRPAELEVARGWLEAGGRLVVVADQPSELALAHQLAGRMQSAPLRDGAFVGSPERPVVPDGVFRYQLDGALALTGPPAIASAGLAWVVADTPPNVQSLRPFAFAVRFPIGNGSILVLGDSHPLENAGRSQLDNERLVERIADELAAGGGAVFVDEGHRSGGLPVRVDLALRGIDGPGRLALGLIVALVVVTTLFPWPSRLWRVLRGAASGRLQRESATAVRPDPVAAVALLHPDWDPRLLARLAASAPDESQGGPPAPGTHQGADGRGP